MTKIVILGAELAGHLAALYLGDRLGKEHTITMVHYSDSFIYARKGKQAGTVIFKLAPVYKRVGTYFIAGMVTTVHVDESRQYVVVKKENGDIAQVEYDHLIVAQRFSPDMPARGMPIKYLDKGRVDVTEKVVDKNGFILVDGAEGDTSRYQSTSYPHLFAIGSAIEDTSTDAGTMGHIVAHNIINLVGGKEKTSSIRNTKARPINVWKKPLFLWKLRALPFWKIIKLK